MSSIRVLHFYKQYMPHSTGGVEQSIFQLCEGAIDQGLKPQVLTLADQPGQYQIARHQVTCVRKNFELASTGFSYTALSHFKALAAEADLIHFHFPWPFMDLVKTLSRIRKPSLVTYHSDIVKQKHLLLLYRPLMLHFLEHVDQIIATSPAYLNNSEILQTFYDKVTCIPLGLDETLFPAVSNSNLSTWHARFPEPFFLFVGQLRYYKGLQFLLDAAQDLPFPILIAGTGPEEENLKQHALALGLKHVHFLGSVSDLDKASLLHLCRCFVFPSHLRSEAFGLALLEAAMHGKPMISCEIGTGTSYINLDAETGKVVPPANPAALREAMLWMVQHPEAAHTMGKAARLRYLTHFTGKVMVERYIHVYQRLLSGISL